MLRMQLGYDEDATLMLIKLGSNGDAITFRMQSCNRGANTGANRGCDGVAIGCNEVAMGLQ